MRVMLFGAAGQVGSECAILLEQHGYDVIRATRQEVDFGQPDNVSAFVRQDLPNIVVNACAYTAVDKAESEGELANLINHSSVAALAEVCAEHSIPIIHLSTDYVFDGTATEPYIETSPTHPLGVYGRTKLQGEQALIRHWHQHIILRTSWVFGSHGNNFVKTMLRLAAERDELNVVNDQRGCPTYAGDIARVILVFIQLYEKRQPIEWGVYHCVNQGETTWYDFAEVIIQEACLRGILVNRPVIKPISSVEYPTPAARPMYSVLNTDKLEAVIGTIMPSWRTGVALFLDRYVPPVIE